VDRHLAAPRQDDPPAAATGSPLHVRTGLPLFPLMLLGASLAGCATASLDLAAEQPDRPWQPTTTASGELVPGKPSATANTASRLTTGRQPIRRWRRSHRQRRSIRRILHTARADRHGRIGEPITRVAWNDARNAALAAGIAKSSYLPQISASALGGYQNGHGSVSGALGSVGTNSSGHGGVGVLSLQWLLFDFGERAGIVEAAEQTSLAANIAFTAAHQRIIHDVSVAFYRYQARARGTVQQAMENADAVLAAAKSRFQRGIGTVVEVAQATQNRAQTNLAMVRRGRGDRCLPGAGHRDRHLAIVEAAHRRDASPSVVAGVA
jgi:outer membrane protein TolC